MCVSGSSDTRAWFMSHVYKSPVTHMHEIRNASYHGYECIHEPSRHTNACMRHENTYEWIRHATDLKYYHMWIKNTVRVSCTCITYQWFFVYESCCTQEWFNHFPCRKYECIHEPSCHTCECMRHKSTHEWMLHITNSISLYIYTCVCTYVLNHQCVVSLIIHTCTGMGKI